MHKTGFIKYQTTLLFGIFIFANSIFGQITNNTVYDYQLAVKTKKNAWNITFKTIYKNNCFTDGDSSLVIGAYKLHKKGVDGVVRAMEFYPTSAKHRILISDSNPNSNSKGNGEANINLAFLTGDIQFCENISKKQFVIDTNYVSIEEVFKDVTFELTERIGLNSGDFKLLTIPLIGANNEIINEEFRKLVFIKDHKALSRNYFIIWNKDAIPELPKKIRRAKLLKIEPLFSADLIEKPISSNNLNVENLVPSKVVLSESAKEIKSVMGIRVFFKGDCPDDLQMKYKISGQREEPLTLNAQTKTNKILIPYKFPVHYRDYDELVLELIPPAGYYLKKISDKSNTINQNFVTYNITRGDTLLEVQINTLSRFHLIYVDVNTFSKKKSLLKSLRDSLSIYENNNDRYLLFLANNDKPSFASTKKGYFEILGKIQSQNLQPGRFNKDWELIRENLPDDFEELHKLNPTSIILVLSENIYNTRRKEIIDDIITNIGDNTWNIYVITDFKPKKYLKSEGNYEVNLFREPNILK